MNKLFKLIKEKFLNKEFIIFCIIGVINTAINFLVLRGSLKLFSLIYSVSAIDELGKTSFEYYFAFWTSTLLAFVISSICSYFMNAKFTYKTKENQKNAFYSAVAFIVRFILTFLLTLGFYELTLVLIPINEEYLELTKTIVNTIVSLAMVPPFFLIFKIIFKGKKKEIKEGEEK